MTARSVVHASFTISRHWKASPARVFAAFADPVKKQKWFGGGTAWEEVSRSFDFREGGRETAIGAWRAIGIVTDFECIYLDIVPDERILYSYTVRIDGVKISVSQACIELHPDGDGTRFVLTEYGDYLDGYEDKGSREHGTNALMDALAKTLQSA
jgi:uncharacterized protein YndB with AHSA1/START domain